ncbi:hypothetical protein [Nevskia sp.]|uniref:hypothetical protein n=1 Tax=Nevskia sp. TaxID=1929292 RepID=UPI0025FDD5EC|nr:hypothetical protein [Nevskia sp.]
MDIALMNGAWGWRTGAGGADGKGLARQENGQKQGFDRRSLQDRYGKNEWGTPNKVRKLSKNQMLDRELTAPENLHRFGAGRIGRDKKPTEPS